MKKVLTVAALMILTAAVACFSLAGALPGYADNVYNIHTDGLGGFVVEHNGEELTYNNFESFLATAEDGATLQFGDGNGTVDIGSARLIFANDKDYTLSGKITGSISSSIIFLAGSGNLVLDNVQLYNRLFGDVIQHNGSGKITVNDGATSMGALIGSLIVNSASGEIEINDGIYSGISRNITNTADGTVSLYGGRFTNTGFTNVIYNTSTGTINLGGNAELYSNQATRTVYNLDGGAVNVSDNVSLKHIRLGNIVDEEGVINGDLGRLDNYSIYNGAPTGTVNFAGSPTIKGKVLVNQPVNVIGTFGNLEVPIVIEYPQVAQENNVVIGCTDSSLFRLVSSVLRLSSDTDNNNLVAITKEFIYFIGNADSEKYILTAENSTTLLVSYSIDAITKYIKDDVYGTGKSEITITFQNPGGNPLSLYNTDSIVLDNKLTNNIKGIGIINSQPETPLIVVSNADTVVNIDEGNYTAKGIALDVAEGRAQIGGTARFYTERTDGATIQLEPGAVLDFSGITFGGDVNNAVTFMLASDSGIVANSIISLDAVLAWATGDTTVAAVLSYNNGTENSKILEGGDGYKSCEFVNADFAGLSSVSVIQAQEREKYTITYVMLADDELADTTEQYYRGIGISVEDMPNPPRDGYTFDGWYGYYIPVLDIYGGRYDSIPTTQRGNLTLYAKWSFGAPEVILDKPNLVYEAYYKQTVSIIPIVSHALSSQYTDITYNYYWEKLDGNEYVFISNSLSLTLTQVSDSGQYRLGVSANRGGNESRQTIIENIIVDIKPFTLFVTGGFTAKDKIYTGNDEAEVVYDGRDLFPDEPYFPISFEAAFADKKAGVDKGVTIVFTSENSNYEIAPYTALKADIAPKLASVNGLTARDKVFDGSTDILLTGGALQGILESDQVELVKDARASSDDAGRRDVITELSLLGFDADNYELAQVVGLKATIAPLPIGVSWGATQFTYNGNYTAPTATADAGVNNETVAVTVDGAQKDAASFEYLAIATTENANYILTNATVRYTIAPLEAEISWGELEFIYDGSLKKVNPTISNLFEGDEGVALIVNNGYNTEVGQYTALITGINSLNYKLPEDSSVLGAVYTIAPAVIKTTGVKGTIACPQGFGVDSEVTLAQKSADNNSLLNGFLSGNMMSNGTYTIGFVKGGVPQEPKGELTVSFEAKGIMLLKNPKILVVENGKVVEKDITIDGNTVTFKTSSTGDFMLVSTRTYTLYYIILGAVVLILLIIVLAVALTRKYSVEFVTDGSAVEPVRIRGGKKTYLMPSRKEDYIFKGWYLDAEGNKSFDAAKMPRKNIKLFAKWQKCEYEGFELALQRAEEISNPSKNADKQ